MAKRKRFNIKDLYPADYYFDWEAFRKDPEGYPYTEADIAYSNAVELARYEAEVPMTPYEIMEKTGLSLEEIANPLKRDPDFTKNQGSKDIEGYHVGSHIIGFTLIDPGWREELREQGRKLGKQTRKRKTK